MRTIALCFVLLAGFAGASIYHGVGLAPDGVNAWVVTIDTVEVQHSSDGGAGWEAQSIGTIRNFFDVFALNANEAWTCGIIGDIWHTSSGGASWQRQNLGGPKFATRIQFVDAQHGWAASGEAILLHTTDGGSEWRTEFFPNPPYPPQVVDFQGLSLLGPGNGWLVAGRYPEGDSFWGGQGYVVHVYDSAGTLAKRLARQDTMYDFFDVAFPDAQNGWVVGGYDRTNAACVLRTSDGGGSWVGQSLPGSARFLRAVHFVDEWNGWACGRNGTIIRTTDGGASWEAQYCPSDTTLFDIEFADTERGIVVGNSIVMYTTDGGEHWVRSFGGIAEGGAGPGRAGPVLRPSASPARGRVVFADAVAVFTPAGRLVRRLAAGAAWDGRDEAGRPVESGSFVARAGSGATARFVFVR